MNWAVELIHIACEREEINKEENRDPFKSRSSPISTAHSTHRNEKAPHYSYHQVGYLTQDFDIVLLPFIEFISVDEEHMGQAEAVDTGWGEEEASECEVQDPPPDFINDAD